MSTASPGPRRAPALLALAFLACGPRLDDASAAGPGLPAVGEPVRALAAGRAFVVWESNRDGGWRLWTRELDGSPPRVLGKAEPRRHHCCPQISPDGRRVAYLSLDPGPTYQDGGDVGELRLLELADGAERVLAERARTYFENRAVVWRGDDRLVFLDGEARTVELELANGATRVLLDKTFQGNGWLPDPTLRWATTGTPVFSPFDAATGRVRPGKVLGGCEPVFSPDGRWGVWVAGAGGPLRGLELETGTVTTVVAKSDPRLPASRGYLYFPMFSRDGRRFAFAGSDDGHDHATSDYDVFVADVDPDTLQIAGSPTRVTEDPGSDRYPDVWAAPEARLSQPTPDLPPAPRTTTAAGDGGWPSDRDGLIFLWDSGDRPNEVEDRELGGRRSVSLAASGRAFLDGRFAMTFRGGRFQADAASADMVLREAERTNELTFELTLTADGEPAKPAPIVASSGGSGMPNFVLAQSGRRLLFTLLTQTTRRDATHRNLELGEVTPGRPLHVALAYTPGRLVGALDGKVVLDTDVLQSGFYHWRPRPLVFGGAGDDERGGAAWIGRIEAIAFYNRFLSPEELRENARLDAERRRRAEPPRRREVTARLVATSRVPTLREIAPYREALGVFLYDAGGERLRVVHRVLLDGEVLPIAKASPGVERRLVVEPFADHLELEALYLSDTTGGDGELLFDEAID